jgi:hypothetical protein
VQQRGQQPLARSPAARARPLERGQQPLVARLLAAWARPLERGQQPRARARPLAHRWTRHRWSPVGGSGRRMSPAPPIGRARRHRAVSTWMWLHPSPQRAALRGCMAWHGVLFVRARCHGDARPWRCTPEMMHARVTLRNACAIEHAPSKHRDTTAICQLHCNSPVGGVGHRGAMVDHQRVESTSARAVWMWRGLHFWKTDNLPTLAHANGPSRAAYSGPSHQRQA